MAQSDPDLTLYTSFSTTTTSTDRPDLRPPPSYFALLFWTHFQRFGGATEAAASVSRFLIVTRVNSPACAGGQRFTRRLPGRRSASWVSRRVPAARGSNQRSQLSRRHVRRHLRSRWRCGKRARRATSPRANRSTASPPTTGARSARRPARCRPTRARPKRCWRCSCTTQEATTAAARR